MTPDEFWNGDNWLPEVYRDAHNLTTERRNHEAWLQGYYFYDALSTALHNTLSKKGSKLKKYSDPVRITPLSKVEKEEKKRAEVQKFISHFTLWQKRFDAKKEGGG